MIKTVNTRGYKTIFLFVVLFFCSGKGIAQDWANLSKYKSENEKMISSNENHNSVVSMGDSITEMWSVLSPDFFNGKAYINRGISGQTTPQMLVRFRADIINLKPELVVIMAGTNDIAGNTGPSTIEMIADNIFSMLEIAKVNKIKAILCSTLPASKFSWNLNAEPTEKIVLLNTLLKKYSKTNKIPYVDYYSKMVDSNKGLNSDYSKDGVHPNVKGYQIMNSMIEEVIAETLKK